MGDLLLPVCANPGICCIVVEWQYALAHYVLKNYKNTLVKYLLALENIILCIKKMCIILNANLNNSNDPAFRVLDRHA